MSRQGPICFALSHLDDVDSARSLHQVFLELAPTLDLSVSWTTARARQQVAFGRAASAAGAPGDCRVLGNLAHFVHPDGLGAWDDMGALEPAFRRLAAWAKERVSSQRRNDE